MIPVSEHTINSIVAWAAGVGVLWPLFQSLIQKPWWSPKAKAILTAVGAVVFGAAAYVSVSGFDFSDPSRLFGWMLGLYGAIQVGYQALKRPVLDQLENKGNGAAEINAVNAPETDDDKAEFADELPPSPYGPDGPKAEDDDHIVTQ